MSRVHPPGEPVPLAQPFGCVNATPGDGGQVVSVGAMYWSMLNGALVKWLWNVVPVVESVHVTDNGGDVRLTSSWSRQSYRLPAWLTWTVWLVDVLCRPFTPGHRPYRLSKLWFSS